MATITSVNNTTTAGAIYSVHDPATWIGGVVPGPSDTVVFQSSQATRWQIRQNWTIGNMTFSASTNRSQGSYLEIPSDITGNITFTQTAGSWDTSVTPTWANAGEFYYKWFLINNPAGTTVTCNIPGGIGLNNGTSCSGDIDMALILITAQGNVYLNVPYIQMTAMNHCNGNWRWKNTVRIEGGGGYTEINAAWMRGGANYSQCSYAAALWGAVAVRGLTNNGTAQVRLNIGYPDSYSYGGCYQDQNAPVFVCDGNLGTNTDGVIINITDSWYKLGAAGGTPYRGNRGLFYLRHTGGNVKFTGADMKPYNAAETWPGVGYNENNDQTYGRRWMVYSDNSSTSTNIPSTTYNCNVYGPNNNYSTQTATGNWALVHTSGHTVRVYGNVYTSPKNRFQVPFYFDNRQSYYYQMSGTVYTSISPAVFVNTIASNSLYPVNNNTGDPLLYGGGVYFGNTVNELDSAGGTTYVPNTTPYLAPVIAPNPLYQSGAAQVQWVFRRSPSDITTTVSMIHADYTGYSPAPANVRLGTVYGGGTKTGTLAVPQPFQVAYGIATDNTVGTWTGVTNVIDANTIADVIWNYNLGNITNTTTGAGKRLTNTATIESTGQQIAALGV